MTEKTAEGTAARAYGKALATSIVFPYKWTEYETTAELQAAGDLMSLEEQRKARNAARQNNARNKAQNAALEAAGIEKPTVENDEQLRLRQMFESVMASKRYSEEAARELCSTTLGIEWAE